MRHDNTPKKIRTLRDLLKYIENLPPHNRRIYRGQNVDEPLLPPFARAAQKYRIGNPLESERLLIDSFARLSIPYLPGGRPQNDYELMAVAQHYGVPTRLLDWTGNPLFALWFAVRDTPSTTKESLGSFGTFWVLDVEPEHLIQIDEEAKNVWELKTTRVFRPAHITQRIVAQDGWFTAHWYIEAKGKFVPLEKQTRFREHLHKFFIPQKNFKPLQKELHRLGIRTPVLFPELSTLSEEIVKDFFAGK